MKKKLFILCLYFYFCLAHADICQYCYFSEEACICTVENIYADLTTGLNYINSLGSGLSTIVVYNVGFHSTNHLLLRKISIALNNHRLIEVLAMNLCAGLFEQFWKIFISYLARQTTIYFNSDDFFMAEKENLFLPQ